MADVKFFQRNSGDYGVMVDGIDTGFPVSYRPETQRFTVWSFEEDDNGDPELICDYETRAIAARLVEKAWYE